MAVTKLGDNQWMVEVRRFGTDTGLRAQFVVEATPAGLVIQPWRIVHYTRDQEEYPLPCTKEVQEFYEPLVVLEMFRPMVDSWVAYKDPNQGVKKAMELATIKKLFGRGGGVK